MTEATVSIPKSSDDIVAQVLPIVGSNGVLGAISLYLVKRWINGMLLKIGHIETLANDLKEIRTSMEQFKEKFAELKPTIQKVDQIDKTVAVLDAKAEAAHRRLDEFSRLKLNN